MNTKIRKHNKTFILIYLLFAAGLFAWLYFKRAFDACNINNRFNNQNNNCAVYKDMGDFCLVFWLVTLIVLTFFTINNIHNKGVKALKTPALVILATVALYFISDLVLVSLIKK